MPPPKILVVDDDDTIRQLVSTILRREHCFEVHTANGGMEALSKISLTSYDVVVLDLMMPVVSGAEVLERLALLDPLHKCVVLMSAASPLEIARSITPNVCVALQKPFDVGALVTAVDKCIDASCGPVAPPERRPLLPRAA